MPRLSVGLIALAPFALTFVPPAFSQTPFRHSGGESKHATYSPSPNEHIDPASGSLSLVATDLVLPGNAGFDLRVTRIYNSSVYPNYDPNGSTELDEDSWAGIGWRLHFGRVLNPDSATSGATVIEMGDGSRHPLYTTTAYPEGWITPGFGRYDRSTHTFKLPNGYVYTFGHVANLGGSLGTVRYVTEIRDPFNNKIEFSYFGAPGPVDGVEQIRQYLSPSQIRYVNFTYDNVLNSLKTMAYDGRIWTYTHDAQGTAGMSLLRQAKPPLGPHDQYDYSPTMPGELTKWWTSAGGTATYTYQDRNRRASTLIERSRVVTERVTGGRLVTGGTWTFEYGTGSNEDTTVVSCSCGVTKYRFLGVGVAGDFSAWKSGALAEQTIEQGGVVFEHRIFNWIRSEAISPDPVPGTEGIWSDPAVYTALLESTATTRGSQTWTTTQEYHTTNYNDYGQPWRRTETGDFTRTTERTFKTGFVPHIVARPETVSTRVGEEMVTATWGYDVSTGFVTSYVGPKSPLRTFVPRADGNLASERDALNNVTTHDNYTWGKPQLIQTPKLGTLLQINEDGSIRSAGNAVVVDYFYDLNFRQTQVRSAGVNPVFTHYDNVANATYWHQQGTAIFGQDLDGFGRSVVSAVSTTGVKSKTTYDACGRAVFSSMPYTTGPGTVGSTTQYDALGRITRVTAPDGRITQYAHTAIDVVITDPAGRTTAYEYSAAGSPGAARLMSVRDADNKITAYTYDVLDMLVRVSGPGTVPDRLWSYDAAGFLLSATQPESGTTTYVYDAAKNLVRKTDAKGQIVLFEYDENNRLTKYDPPGTADDVILTYNTLGQLTSQASSTTTTTFTYNTAGQLASKTDAVSGQSFASLYEYDLNENLTKITYPSGRIVTYEYDGNNRLLVVRQNGAIFADDFRYDDAGRLTSYRTGTVTHTLTFDVAGRTQQLTSGTALNLTYAYDPVGNVTSITEPAQPTQTFGYDAVSRLTGADGPWGFKTWSYTPAGDRTAEVGAGTTFYNYDPTTRRLMSTTGTRAESFSYDNIGQLTQDGRGTYTYSASGLVTQFTGPNVTAAYSYDPSGLRVARTVNNITTYTVRSSGGSVLSEYRAACGNPVWSRDILYAGGRLLGSIKATTTEPTVTLTAATATVAEAQPTVTATIQLAIPGGGASACPVTVSYEAIATTSLLYDKAMKDVDFSVASGSVTFAAGSAHGAIRTVSMAITNDAMDEENETFAFTLSSVIGGTASGTTTQTITITDDDAPPTVSIADAAVTEVEGSSAVLVLNVSLSNPSGRPISMNYSTANGTAVAGADYEAGAATFTISPGSASQTIHIAVLPDILDEPEETLTVTLSNIVNATLADAGAVGTILDNDPPMITLAATQAKAGKIARFTLTLSSPAGAGTSVQYTTVNGTAAAPSDYTYAAGTATFAAGAMSTTVDVQTAADVPEADETFTLQLSAPINATLQQTSATGTILNRRKGDLNGDGKAEILWQRISDGLLVTWVMDGLTKLYADTNPDNPGAAWEVVGTGDFNDDGHQDLLMQRPADGILQVWAMNDLRRSAVLSVSSGGLQANWKVRGVADFNGDGKPDIVMHHLTADLIVVWLMNGTTVASNPLTTPSAIDADLWKLSAVGDFSADGQADFIWREQISGWLSAWLMNGVTRTSDVSLSPNQVADLNWRILACADYNSAGQPDLLWHHQAAGSLSVWLMSGTSVASASFLPDIVDPTIWRLVGPR